MRTSAGRFLLASGLWSAGALAVEPAQPAPSPAHCIPVWLIDASGIRQLPDRCLDPNAPADTAALAAPSADDPCDPPTFVDARGIQRVRPECLGGAASPASAAAPADAAAQVPPAAAPPAARPGCDPPWWFDARGIRRLHFDCLEGSPAPAAASPTAGPAAPAPPAAAAPSPARPGCDPPWYVDAQGVQRLRVHCL